MYTTIDETNGEYTVLHYIVRVLHPKQLINQLITITHVKVYLYLYLEHAQ